MPQRNSKRYEFEAVIHKVPDIDGAYVVFPHDIRAEFSRGRVPIHATFDGEPYVGSIVNMGLTSEDGSICYVIGVRKDIRATIGKQPGDAVSVTVVERDTSLDAETSTSGSSQGSEEAQIAPSPVASIDDYILAAPKDRRDSLQRVRETIARAAPKATECIKWRMPTFVQEQNLIHFAHHRNHLGLYPGSRGVAEFAERLSAMGITSTKGAIQLPWSRPIPYDVIDEIVRFRVRQVDVS